jgi:hypothetical protein
VTKRESIVIDKWPMMEIGFNMVISCAKNFFFIPKCLEAPKQKGKPKAYMHLTFESHPSPHLNPQQENFPSFDVYVCSLPTFYFLFVHFRPPLRWRIAFSLMACIKFQTS